MKLTDPMRMVKQSEATLSKALEAAISSLVRRRSEIDKEIESLRSRQKVLGGNGSLPAKIQSRKKRTRIRRSSADLRKIAQDVVAAVKSSKEGITGPELKKQFGLLLPTAKLFVQKYHGLKLKTTGSGAQTRYMA